MKLPRLVRVPFVCFLIWLFVWLLPVATSSFAADGPDQLRRHALLIGCTEYPNLDETFQLRGPVNDVALVRRLLIDRFEYRAEEDDIVVLAASESDDYQPTRAHIEREFQRLLSTVQPGEPVVILMAGHGSQQPDNDPDNPADHEPDGLDEIFLPADVSAWDGEAGTVRNALVDDELRDWIRRMVQRGAFVWLIMDACHSGSGVRGSGVEISRQVPAGQFVPQAALDAAYTARRAPPDQRVTTSPFQIDGPGGIVAMYAAQPHETTPERRLPIDADDGERKYYGLLTYTICEILTTAGRGITFTELVQAVQTRYLTLGRRAPTPLLEGSSRDNLVLGRDAFPERSRILLERRGLRKLTVSAGALQGLTKGSVLAVYPAVGSQNASDETPLGHVQVVTADLNRATVRPCQYEGVATNEKLPLRGRCEIVFQDFGEYQLRVAVDHRDVDGNAVPDAVRRELLSELAPACGQLISLVDDPAESDWLLRLDAGRIQLVPAAGVPAANLPDHESSLAPIEPMPGWGEHAAESLVLIARARNLVRLTSVASRSTEGEELGLQMTLVDAAGEPLRWQASGVSLKDGDRVTVRMHNSGRHSIDVTLLYVDSAYGITCLYPGLGEINRLNSGDRQQVTLDVNAETTGLESLVAIVVRGQRQPVDFSLLEQPSLETIASVRGAGVMNSPLGELCRAALYGAGATRGISRTHSKDYGVNVVSWRIQSPVQRKP